MQALVLVAHCKALEARGPIASHSAGPPVCPHSYWPSKGEHQ